MRYTTIGAGSPAAREVSLQLSADQRQLLDAAN
jgi:hypothetical protein